MGSASPRSRAVEQLGHHRLERVQARRPRLPRKPVRRRQRARRVGGAVPGRQPQLDRLTGRVESHEVHPRRGSRAHDGHLELVGCRRPVATGIGDPALPGVRREDAARELLGGAGGPVGFRPAVPLQEIRIEGLERPEERGRRVDQPPEEGHPEAEVGGRHGGRAVVAQDVVDGAVGGLPAGGGDDEAAATGGQGGRHVRRHGGATRRLEDEVDTGEVGRVVAIGRGPAQDPHDRLAPLRERGRDRAAHAAVPQDDRSHLRTSLPLWAGPAASESPDRQGRIERPRSPRGVRGPWSLRARWPRSVVVSRAVRAPGPVPPGRAARASSSIQSRRCGA